MPPRKRGGVKRAAPSASILSYFSKSVRAEDARKSGPNANNNNGNALKRKLSEMRHTDVVTEAIVISSDDEDFENVRFTSPIKRKKCSERKTKVKKEVLLQDKSEPFKEKQTDVFETDASHICKIVKNEVGMVETNANGGVHIYFSKNKSIDDQTSKLSSLRTSTKTTENTVNDVGDDNANPAELDSSRCGPNHTSVSDDLTTSRELPENSILTNDVSNDAHPVKSNGNTSLATNLDKSVCKNFTRTSISVNRNISSDMPGEDVDPSDTIQSKANGQATCSSLITDEAKDQRDALNDHNTSSTSRTESHSSEDDVPEEKIAYYLLNFRQILDTVLGNDDDRSLFEGSDDIMWLNKFNDLPLREQKLYVRLYHRKLAWLRLEQVSYPDIAKDIQSVLDRLAKEGFLQSTEGSSDDELGLGDVLRMLPAPNLKELAKTCRINVNGRPKAQMVSDLQEMCKNQKSVLGGFFGKGKKTTGNQVKSGLQHTVMKRARKLLGPCYKVAPYPRTVFNRVLLVFDVTRGIDDESECTLTGSQNAFGQGRHLQLSAILMAGMGRVQYPDCEVDRPTPIFRTRSDLLHYETAFQFQADVLACVEAGQWEEAATLCSAAHAVKSEMEENDPESCRHSEDLPIFLRCFTAQWTYMRLRSLEVEVLQRLKKYKEAVEILRELLAQRTYCTSRRGHWWERLALNIDQHLKDPKASLDAIYDSLQDSDVRVGHKLALAQRVNKILSSRKAKKSKELAEMYEQKLQPIIDRLQIAEAPVVEITGRLLPTEMQTGKSRFIATEVDSTERESTLLCSVEELALSHYRGLGYDHGIHGEGGTFSTLFCIFMWDIIFMPGIRDVFRTCYQTHPLDFHTDDFYLRREDKIEERLRLIGDLDANAGAQDDKDAKCEEEESEKASALDLMSMTWDVEYGKQCAGLNWDRFSSLEEAQGLVKCIGGKVLAGIFRRFAKDLRHTRSGLPDLVVWNPENQTYKMVEVKGPGDRLSTNQRLWLDELIRLEASVEVCKVIAVGAKKLKNADF